MKKIQIVWLLELLPQLRSPLKRLEAKVAAEAAAQVGGATSELISC